MNKELNILMLLKGKIKQLFFKGRGRYGNTVGLIGIGILIAILGLFQVLLANKNGLKNNSNETVLLQNTKENHTDTLNVIIISGACCDRSLAPFDEEAQKVINKAISETNVNAKVTTIPVTTALFNDSYRKIINEMIEMYNQGKVAAPAILVDGKVISYGVPTHENMKVFLLKYK